MLHATTWESCPAELLLSAAAPEDTGKDARLLEQLKQQNRPETMPIDDVVISDDTDVSAQAEQAELAGIVQEMLAQLPEQDRELLLRFYFYRQSVREIAGEMHMKESTVKTRMYRSRKKLRQLFTERGYGYEQMELV